MQKIIFIVPYLADSHYKNRIIEFQEHGYRVEVYGFEREKNNDAIKLPYSYKSLGILKNGSYSGRVRKYLQAFRELGKAFKNEEVCFYLCGLDIAMFFHFLNPYIKYIYEECDLTHTYMGKAKHLLEAIDKIIIKRSILTIFTSEGFINYHYKKAKPNNICLIENKLNPSIIEHKILERKSFNNNKISIGFVGDPRFDTVLNFIHVFCSNFPEHEFHIFGGPIRKEFEVLRKYKNCFFHGFFKNPNDLPEIYGKINLVLSTYDYRYENVRFAEPNKIYESIYFETPIIVSSGTFLADKVKRLGIGYDVDAFNDNEIVSFINSLSEESINAKIKSAQAIDKTTTLNINDKCFEKLKQIIS